MPDVTPTKRDAVALLRSYSNKHFASAADEHREGVSEFGVRRRYEEAEAAHKALLVEILELQKDRARLDWLAANPQKAELHGGSDDGGTAVCWAICAAKQTLREAIDVMIERGTNTITK